MLSCDEIQNLLSAYYDGELGVAASQQVAEHLASCDECARKLADMSFLSASLSAMDFPVADDKFKASLHDKLMQEAKTIKPRRFGKIYDNLRPYIAAVACLVLVVGIYAAVGRGYLAPSMPTLPSLPQPTADVSDVQAYNAQESATPAPKSEPEKGASDNKIIKTDVKSTSNPESVTNSEPQAENVQSQQTNEPIYEVQPEKMPEDIESTPTPIVPAEATSAPTSEIQLPSDGAKELTPPDSETDSVVLSSGFEGTGSGDGSNGQNSYTTAYFRIDDESKTEEIMSVLTRYGTTEITESCIRVQVLAANYDACVATLRSIEGLDEYNVVTVEGSEHCYIQIDK